MLNVDFLRFNSALSNNRNFYIEGKRLIISREKKKTLNEETSQFQFLNLLLPFSFYLLIYFCLISISISQQHSGYIFPSYQLTGLAWTAVGYREPNPVIVEIMFWWRANRWSCNETDLLCVLSTYIHTEIYITVLLRLTLGYYCMGVLHIILVHLLLIIRTQQDWIKWSYYIYPKTVQNK